MSNLIGSSPNQVPTNGLLGNMAFQNQKSVTLKPQASAVSYTHLTLPTIYSV